jgi:DNA-binding MarR family transcriptional regulator
VLKIEVTSKDNDFSDEMDLIKKVAQRYKILRTLYPRKSLSFMDLASASCVDPANLSRYIHSMEDDDLIIVREISEGVSRPYRLINNSLIAERLIESVIKITGHSENFVKTDEAHIKRAIDLLLYQDIQRLAADQLQIVSRSTQIPPSSSFFSFIGETILDERLDPVRAVLLLSLTSILQKSNYVSRVKIGEKIIPTIRAVYASEPKKRSGIIAKKILDEYYLDQASYEELIDEYLNRVQSDESVQGIRVRLLEKYPEMKIDLRDRLLHIYLESDAKIRECIESEFASLY